jgi:hypothetical protein
VRAPTTRATSPSSSSIRNFRLRPSQAPIAPRLDSRRFRQLILSLLAPINCPLPPLQFPSFPQAREAARPKNFLAGAPHIRCHVWSISVTLGKPAASFLVPLSSPCYGASHRQVLTLVCVRIWAGPPPPEAPVAWSTSGRLPPSHLKMPEVLSNSIAFATSARTSSCPRRHPETIRAPTPSAPEPHVGDDRRNPSAGKASPLPSILSRQIRIWALRLGHLKRRGTDWSRPCRSLKIQRLTSMIQANRYRLTRRRHVSCPVGKCSVN